MKKITLLLGFLMITGVGMTYACGKDCKDKKDCKKEAKCCKDKKNCAKDCKKDDKKAEQKS
jgi:hypothetical protein